MFRGICVLGAVLALAVAQCRYAQATAAACPCSNASLCEPVRVSHDRELLLFSTNSTAWPAYGWESARPPTTVALFRPLSDPELVCTAHAHNARVVFGSAFPVANLSSAADRQSWIDAMVQQVKDSYIDGINVDVEEPIPASSPDTAHLLTKLVGDLATAMHAQVPGSRVTVDVAWSPDCIDGRCYDYRGLADASDGLIIMAYDERSQVKPPQPCVAGANSGLPQTTSGVNSFLGLGIDPAKLLLGVPWYGYDYPCLPGSTATTCNIKKVPFRGVECSDAAGTQMPYSDILETAKSTVGGIMWSASDSSPFFNFVAPDGAAHQLWFDNPKSLSAKFSMARSKGLTGCAMWNVDQVTYGSTLATSPKATQDMWDALQTGCL